ncbi:GNAT family N-acetyltransferase [Halomonas daqiaonensis]|uniref:Acetyltransferase (GNAT) domain-containing protein n=1 Tax=Halomonas daqiaonensis TaxID=650850 RepID=A0A1H7HE52_9GAMM|nr:GNAT family N-acetyltransferase [Halomonas daqiaonensis]SEK48569.1 Acetyltransferase (GNAT) domain-containing protein [Halomonas daqiaonensis]
MIGYEYFHDEGFLWRKHQGTLIPLSMPHRDARLEAPDARALLKAHGALLVRWESNFDCASTTDWWHVIKSEEEHLEVLSRSTRSKVRRGSRQLSVSCEPRCSVLNEGYVVYRQAYERYDTLEPMMSEAAFREAIRQLPPETEFWTVRTRESNELVAFSENLVIDDACFYLSIWFNPASLGQYAAYTLFYEMNLHYLNERRLRYVSDGARSISHDTGIHDFLINRFGFRKAYAKLHVVYTPLLAAAVHALYPFRRLIGKTSRPMFRKLTVLLEQERIHRSFDYKSSLRLERIS